MYMRPELHEIRLKQWEKIIAECNASDMSKHAWCKEHNIKDRQFQYWQALLREEALKKVEKAGSTVPAIPTQTEASTFVDITPQTDVSISQKPEPTPSIPVSSPSSNSPEVRIEYSGFKIYVQSAMSEDVLKMVLRTLKNA